jgi:molybdate-binding protein/DNA-binding transcriptional regulator YhcF (GntR family)
MIDITLKPGQPEYMQIVEQVRWCVANGQLRPGDHLEPVRTLAQRLGVNPSTVARAYRLLELQGVVETHRRRGTVVCRADDGASLRDLRYLRLRSSMERALLEALALGYTVDEVEAVFDVQLAAWRERRRQPSPPSRGNGRHLLRFAGSHDLALETLWAHARRSYPQAMLDIAYVGSLDGLLKLLRGEVSLAGSHMLDEETGTYNLPILRRLFVGQRLCVVTLAEREQGLLVAPGNPKAIHSLHDVARPDIRFINRQPGSGTRALLDYHLCRMGIPAQAISGYSNEALTHTQVAEAIARGVADVGLGLRAAANAFSLDFIFLARERYDLVTPAEERASSALSWLFDMIGSQSFKAAVAALGGYDTAHSGEEVYL